MAVILAQAVTDPFETYFGVINHHYLLAGNEAPVPFTDEPFAGGGVPIYRIPSPDNKTLEKTATPVWDFTQIFYNRIAVIPDFLDVGNVSSAQTFQVEVWNGFFENRTLDAINELNAEGIIVANGIPIGGTYYQLNSSTYDVTINADGPPIINAFINWVLTPDTGTLNIVGNRLNVFAYEPDTKLVESLRWYTDIIQAYSSEQRIRVRDKARQVFEFVAQADNGIQTRMNNIMYGWQDKVFALPYWVDAVKHPLPINALDMEIYFDTSFLDFRDGGLAIIWENDYTNEAVEIDTVEADHLNLLREVVNDYPNGALVIPLVRVLADGGLRKQIGRGDDTQSTITFRGLDNVEFDNQAPVTWTEFDGYEVIDSYNAQFGSIDSVIKVPQRFIDNISGRFQPFPERDHTDESFSQGFIVRDKEVRYNLKQLLYRRMGRLKPFWLDTNRRDYEVLETIGAGAAEITVFVANQKFLDLANTKFGVHMVLKDGQDFYRNLVGLASEDLVNNREIIEIDAAFGVEILPEDVERLSLLILSRFDTDNLALEHFVGEGVITKLVVPTISLKNPEVS